MTVFALPDLGEGLQEAEIVSWHVSIGEHVIADQPLVSVETDKAVVEIPAPFSGTVAGLLAEPGDVLPVGTPLAEIDTGATADTGAIVGEIGAPGPAPPERPAMPRKEAQPRPVPAAPGVRKLARERGVDLSLVTGTGPGGAILSTDVLAAEGSAEGEPLRGVRRSMARAMARSGAAVVPATLHDWADIHAWPPGEAPRRG